jgi:DNA-binding protein H-NS
MARPANLASMSVETLLKMRDQIGEILSRKAEELKRQLSVLNGDEKNAPKHRTRKVAPKYRGPKGELWSGRGMKPRWLVAELKKGRRVEDFGIGKRGRRKKAA